MNYKGKELKEYRSEEPIFFDPPKRMLCWNRDRDIPIECRVFSYENRPSISVVVAEAAEDDMPQTWKHCAEIPEEYFALVVVEHRAVSGINRYGLGKFVTREDAKFVMDRMVELLGGDPQTGSKDIYIVPFDAVKDFPYGAYDKRMNMDKIPDYLVDAYEKATKKFLGEEDTGRPRIKDLRENVGIAQKVETCNNTFEARQALARELRAKTGINYIRCKQTLEYCGWIYNEAYYKLMGEYPTREAPQEHTDECSSTKKETVQHVMERELSNEDKVAMVTKLRQKTERGMFPCKRALEECGWDYDKAYALIRELPAARAPKEPSSDEKLTDMEARTLKNKMVAELVYKTGWGAYHCKKALQACEWKSDAAERMLKEKFKDFATKK